MFGWRLIREAEYSMAQALIHNRVDREINLSHRGLRYTKAIYAFLIAHPEIRDEYLRIYKEMEDQYDARV